MHPAASRWNLLSQSDCLSLTPTLSLTSSLSPCLSLSLCLPLSYPFLFKMQSCVLAASLSHPLPISLCSILTTPVLHACIHSTLFLSFSLTFGCCFMAHMYVCVHARAWIYFYGVEIKEKFISGLCVCACVC